MARAMKDSGIEWIGEIPEGWRVVRNKGLFYEVDDRCISGSDYTLLSVSEYTGVTPRSAVIKEGEFETHAESLDGYKICKPGDIVMNIMLAWKRATAASNYEGIISPAYCVFRGKGINTKFFHYLFRTDNCAEMFKRYSTGIIDSRLRLYPDVFLSLYSIVPPIAEQTKIVSFLDAECARIDVVIEQTRASIEEYKKLKQSVITQAVTKGIRPGRKMKGSGVEWIGEIPEEWDRLNAHRLITSTQNGLTRRDLEESSGQIVLKLKNISSSGVIDYSFINRITLTEEEIERYALKHGDFLFVRVNGSKALVGKCAIFTGKDEIVAYNDHIIRVRLNSLIEKEYFHWYLLSNVGRIEIDLRTSTAAGQFTISGEGLRDINILLPPVEEQKQIVEYLNRNTEGINAIIHQKEAVITQLESYKKSLIFEYVTGKKEVQVCGKAKINPF